MKKFLKKNESYQRLTDKFFSYLKPGKSRSNHIGLEIEIASKIPQNILAWEFLKAGLNGYTTLANDASIRVTAENPYKIEIRVLCKEHEIKIVIPKVMEVLKLSGAIVNKSCGLHVHLDMRKRDVTQAYKNLVDSLPYLKTKVAKGRTRNKFCKMNKTNNYTEFLNGKVMHSPGGIEEVVLEPSGRYSAINAHAFNDHKTLECRLHEGTLNPKKVTKWVETLVEVVNEE